MHFKGWQPIKLTGEPRPTVGDFNATLAFTPLSGAPFGTPGVCRRSPTTTRPKNLNRCALPATPMPEFCRRDHIG
jgi:hypothetical protein